MKKIGLYYYEDGELIFAKETTPANTLSHLLDAMKSKRPNGYDINHKRHEIRIREGEKLFRYVIQ